MEVQAIEQPALIVTAVIDSRQPPAWVVALLHRIDRNALMVLHSVQVQDHSRPGNALPARTTSLPQGKRRGTLASRASNLILDRLIDRPRFQGETFTAVDLPECLACNMTAADAPLATGSTARRVHLQLTDTPLGASGAPAHDINPHTLDRHGTDPHRTHPDNASRHWSADPASLSARCRRALLDRQPFLPLTLWERSDSMAISHCWRLASTHCLPLQSFSISDIEHYAFGALPGFIESRLIWLAHDAMPAVAGDHESSDAKAAGLIRASDIPRALRLLWHQSRQRLQSRFQKEQWQLAVLPASAGDAQTSAEQSGLGDDLGAAFSLPPALLQHARAITPPADRLWADPFLATQDARPDARQHVFFESLVFGEQNATIAVAEIDANGLLGEPENVLEEPFHLSYPFVFRHGNDHFMIPETAGHRSIRLYRATDYPLRWRFERELLGDIDAADTTLLQHDGRWWLFTNTMTHAAVDERDELRLYHAADLHTDGWQPHPLNPVVTGVDQARMAGPLWRSGGSLFRPAQYGAWRYGYGVGVARVDTLTPTEYRETLTGRFTPASGSGWSGGHTLCASSNLLCIDRVTYIWRK